MKLDARALAIAAATVAGAMFTACTLAVATAPRPAYAFISRALHVDLAPIAAPVTLGGFVQGLLFVAGSAFAGALLAAWIYNRAAGSASRGSRAARP